ncbi:MAG: SOS response-associated peptidase [Alphaproteobacteria bacterium]|nr:SOS response-associated peptidase [Alphaproteobacteria bacterium]
MCGRYAFTLPKEAMRGLFALLNPLDYPPRYNIAPTQPVIAIWQTPKGREAALVRWGLVPAWVKDPQAFPLIINARIETIRTKPAFRSAIRHQRCIVPASGYFEWIRAPDGGKQPWYISMQNGEPMAFAGIYATWEGPDGEEIDTMAILTQQASGALAKIHHRAPVALTPAQIDSWLDVRSVGADEALTLALPLDGLGVTGFPVSKRVNSARNEGAELIERIELTGPN